MVRPRLAPTLLESCGLAFDWLFRHTSRMNKRLTVYPPLILLFLQSLFSLQVHGGRTIYALLIDRDSLQFAHPLLSSTSTTNIACAIVAAYSGGATILTGLADVLSKIYDFGGTKKATS